MYIEREEKSDFYKKDKQDLLREEYEKAKERDIKVCRECSHNEQGFCRKLILWCTQARKECPKFIK